MLAGSTRYDAHRSVRGHRLEIGIIMRIALVLLVSLVLSAPAHAATPTDASVDQLLVAMKAEQTVAAMLGGIDQMMRQSAAAATRGQTLTDEQKRVMDAQTTAMAQVFRSEMSWETMHPLYVQIYRESFTQEEVDGFTAFYQSPVGQAYVDKMPVVLNRTISLMQSRMAPMMERMKAAIQQAVEEAKKVK